MKFQRATNAAGHKQLRAHRACVGYVASLLQGDRKRGVSKRISRREDGKGHGGGNGLVKLAGVAQGANEAVMGFNVGCVGGDGGLKGLGRLRRLAGSEKIESAVGKRVGGGKFGHGCL
jgi:hypothetical protein